MKISTRTRYGLRLLVCLADTTPARLLNVKEVAERENIPVKYLEQIIRPLKKAGLLQVVRGAKGGYFIARSPEEITIKQVFDILEDGTSLIKCLQAETICEHKTACSTYQFWHEFNQVIDKYLSEVTLADLIKMQQEKCQNLMFYI